MGHVCRANPGTTLGAEVCRKPGHVSVLLYALFVNGIYRALFLFYGVSHVSRDAASFTLNLELHPSALLLLTSGSAAMLSGVFAGVF